MPCIACMIALYLLFPPPLLSSVDPAATADYTAAEYDYVVDDRTPTVELPGKQSHFPSPTYRLLFYIYLLHQAYAAATIQSYFNCIAYHCRPLFTFPISYAAYINMLYISGPCALLVNRLASGP